jgi:copper chaperone
MMTLRFKTNINCINCIRAVSGFLDEVTSVKEWSVDTENPEKILTIKGEKPVITEILEAVEEAGFDVELIA